MTTDGRRDALPDRAIAIRDDLSFRRLHRRARARESRAKAGRSNRKDSGVRRTSRSSTSGAITAAIVTTSATTPTSSTIPVRISTSRVTAMGKKKAR